MPIYSTEQINSFLDRNLIFHGQVSATDRAATRQKVQQVISSAPPEFQAAIIQGNIQYITGRGSEIDLKLGSAGGRSIDEKIYFRLDSAIRTIRRETGHAVDGHIIHDMPEGVSRGAFQIPKGNYVNKPLADNQYGGSQYSGNVYSEASKGWGAALDRELARSVLSPRVDGLPFVNGLKAFVGDVLPSSSTSYPGERLLREHLAEYSGHAFRSEAMAEMSLHYLSLYEQQHGDMATVNRTLTEKYPELWPYYRDQTLPFIQTRVNNGFSSMAIVVSETAGQAAFQPTSRPAPPSEPKHGSSETKINPPEQPVTVTSSSVAGRQTTGSDSVAPKPFAPEVTSTNLLNQLHEAGFQNPILSGGAVRDDYFRNHLGMNVPTNDYDINAGIDLNKVLKGARTTNEATAKLIEHVEKSFPGSIIQSDKDGLAANVRLNPDGTVAAFDSGIKFQYRGKKIEMMFDNDEAKLPLEDRLWGTASITTIAMDRTGKVVADAKFEEHARDRIFQPSQADALADKSYRKLAAKIPGLEYRPPSGTASPVVEIAAGPPPGDSSISQAPVNAGSVVQPSAQVKPQIAAADGSTQEVPTNSAKAPETISAAPQQPPAQPPTNPQPPASAKPGGRYDAIIVDPNKSVGDMLTDPKLFTSTDKGYVGTGGVPASPTTSTTSSLLKPDSPKPVGSTPVEVSAITPNVAVSGFNSITERANGHIGMAAIGIGMTDALLKGDYTKAAEIGGSAVVMQGGMKGVAMLAGVKAVPIAGQIVGGAFAAMDAVQAAKEGNTWRATIKGVEAGLYTTAAVAGAASATGVAAPVSVPVALAAGGAAVAITAGTAVYDNAGMIVEVGKKGATAAATAAKDIADKTGVTAVVETGTQKVEATVEAAKKLADDTGVTAVAEAGAQKVEAASSAVGSLIKGTAQGAYAALNDWTKNTAPASPGVAQFGRSGARHPTSPTTLKVDTAVAAAASSEKGKDTPTTRTDIASSQKRQPLQSFGHA